VVSATATTVCAQDASPAPGTVDAMLHEGVDLRRQGRDDDARAVFEHALERAQESRSDRVAIAEAQLGLAEQAVGRWAPAERHVREALTLADPWIQRNRPDLEEALRTIREHLGSLQVLGSPNGAEVTADGQEIGTLPMAQPMYVPAGVSIVEVHAEGYYPSVRRVAISPGNLAHETFELHRRDGARPSGSSNAMAWVIGGAIGGGVFGLMGVISLGIREGNVSGYNGDPLCPGTAAMSQPSGCSSRINAANAATGFAAVGLAGFGVGAAVVIGGLIVQGTRGSSSASLGRSRTLTWGCAPRLDVVGVTCGIGY
jgi:hypothetical protein